MPVPPDAIAVREPSPREAERLTAAALLRRPDWALEVFERCDERDFADALCAAVYRASRLLCGWGPGSAGVADVYALLRHGDEFGAALPRLLWDLFHATPTAVNGAYHAVLVRRAADRRRARMRLVAAIRDLDDGRCADEVMADAGAA